jgi:hypothetical protein
VRRGLYLSDFLDQPVPLGTLRRICQLRCQAGLLGCELIFKGMGSGSRAVSHGKISSLRILTAGFSGKMLPKYLSGLFHLSTLNFRVLPSERQRLWVESVRRAGPGMTAAESETSRPLKDGTLGEVPSYFRFLSGVLDQA